MTHRRLFLAAVLGVLSGGALAQSSCHCNFPFGSSCGGFELSSPGPWRLGGIGKLVAGPAADGRATAFLLGTRLGTPVNLGQGCSLYVQQTNSFAATTSNGFARTDIALPSDPTLLGQQFTLQATSVTGGTTLATNALSAALTNGAPSSPSPNFPGLQGLTFGCNDGRYVGKEPGQLGEFIAYHARLPAADRARDPHGTTATHTISGDFADLIVNVPELGFVEFGRATSYLPRWVPVSGTPATFPELVARTGGDGDTARPDRINRYSYARVVSADANRIVVHWRYVPDFTDPTPNGVVHELFTIRPSGAVTRVVHRNAGTMETAANTANNRRQTITLSATGLVAQGATGLTRPLPNGYPGSTAVQNNPLTARLSLSFDENTGGNGGRTTLESVSNTQVAVEGRLANWHPGVSGTALSFDGYTSAVTVPSASAPNITDSFTVSCWVSLAAYPFGVAQLAGQARPHGNDTYLPDQVGGSAGIHTVDEQTWQTDTRQLSVGGAGYLLALDAMGRLTLGANLNGQWTTLTAPLNERIPLHRWVHLIGTYDGAEMRLHVDNREVADRPATGSVVIDRGADFVVGLNREPQWIHSGGAIHAEVFAGGMFGIEGLIDEVRVYDRGFGAADITTSNNAGNRNAPVLAQRALPEISGTAFAARSETLHYHKAWNELFHDSGFDDIVVTFDRNPNTKIAFWKGATYGPTWVTRHDNGQRDVWSHDQSMEWGDLHGLVEHMGDKQIRHAHARIVEQTDARIVVQWRYAVVAASGRLFAEANELAWVDEFYTIYPDGTVVRRVQDWFCNRQRGAGQLGWQNCYVLAAPGNKPMDNLHDVVATVVNAGGQSAGINIVTGADRNALIASHSNPAVIWTNTRSPDRLYRGVLSGVPVEYPDSIALPWTPGDPTEPGELNTIYSPFGAGNHFPASQVPTPGREALFDDRVSHSEGWVGLGAGNDVDVMIYGFSRQAADALPMVNFWNAPATVSNATTTSLGYDRAQHAFVFEGGGVNTLSCTLTAQAGRPIQDPGLVVEGWSGSARPTVQVDGRPVATARAGVHFNGGIRTLVVWLPLNAMSANVQIDWRATDWR